MKLLLCNWRDRSHPASGGAEVYSHELLRRWASAGHEVTQFASAVADEPDRAVVDDVEIIRGGTGRLGVYHAAKGWYQAEGRDRFDLIIDEVNTRPFFCHEWAGDTPTVALIHQVAREVWFSEFWWPLASVGRWWLEPRWLSRYQYVPTVTISESSAQSLRSYGLQRVVVAPVGVDPCPDIDLTAKEERPTIAFVGRLAANKQPDHVLQAFARVLEHAPDSQLWMVGSGTMTDDLRRAAPPNVEFFGRVSHERKYELMSRAHVLVVTSVREGWGLVVDEAASVGTPTIGYDVDGLRDSVLAAGGTLVHPHPETLATAVSRHFSELGCARSTPGPSARGAIEWDDAADEILSLVTDMVGLSEAASDQPIKRGRHGLALVADR
ncbi:MAG: glycosyltransferase family 4 protein [Actinomycetia bacterium]|nr:glycosyltransferase family 4 protein [Actinomycetes bacterium]